MTELVIVDNYDEKNLIDDLHKLLIKELCNSVLLGLNKKSSEIKFIKLENLNDEASQPTKEKERTRIILLNPGGPVRSNHLKTINNLLKLTDHLYLVNNILSLNSCKEKYLKNVDFAFNNLNSHFLSLEKVLGESYSKESPHLFHLIPGYLRSSPEHLDSVITKFKIKKTHAKTVGVFLDKCLYHGKKYRKEYLTVLHLLGQFIARIAVEGKGLCPCIRESRYQIYLFSMDRSENNTCKNSKNSKNTNTCKNDYDIAKDLKEIVPFLSNIHLVEEQIIPEDVPSLFKILDFNICARYESVLLSQIYEVPFLTLYSNYDSRTGEKIKELKIEDDSLFIQVDEENLYVPTEFDYKDLEKRWNKLTKNNSHRKVFLRKLVANNNKSLKDTENFVCNLSNLFFYHERRLNSKDTNYFKLLTQIKLDQISTDVAKHVIEQHIEPNEEEPLEDKAQLIKNAKTHILENGIDHLYTALDLSKTRQSEKELLAEILSLRLTKKSKSNYSWGLEEQILTPTYNLTESTKWILNNFYVEDEENRIDPSKLIENDVCPHLRKLDLSYYDQYSLRGVHRSGWPYVMTNLEHYHNPNGVIFDSYGDRTFGWESSVLPRTRKLPLNREWIAVFHHTFNENYSENNLVTVFKNKFFMESLKSCRGIIVLSDYIKIQFEEHLQKTLPLNPVLDRIPPVLKLWHPTEFVKLEHQFSWAKFVANKEKKLVQIGAWLRDTYAIYDLPNPRINKIQKSLLKGKLMENYFPHGNYLESIEDALLNIDLPNNGETGTDCPPTPICRDLDKKSVNKYLTGLLRSVGIKQESVQVIDYLEKTEYDQLLTENLVFIKLVDVSACNTIIECIVRNTPILVNRLPAVEEYLGSGYPLYYETLEEASALLDDYKKIESGHKYLKNMNKNFLRIESFLGNLLHSDLYTGL